MCGIVGLYYLDDVQPCSEKVIKDMRDAITHRGPDDKGVYIDGSLGIAHRRLSIIDVDNGHQPLSTPDGRLQVVFNGEIYNYIELKKTLESAGHEFKTKSDTEVLLYLYLEFGDDFVKKLNGIFSFAIWDHSSRKLFLARDHMGVKPLYYYLNSNVLLFSSEIKSIVTSGLYEQECNKKALGEYFIFRDVSGEQTLFNEVKSLLPGCCMVVKDGNIESTQYWDVPVSAPASVSCDKAIESLDELLVDAVKMQLMSDVPLGSFCSGGIDSSLITALAARQTGAGINTYSVGFNEVAYDETEYARKVSKLYNTDHHELRLTNNDFTALIPEMIKFNDEPLNFPNSVLIYAISKVAKHDVTVVLTGEGADELFGGYPRYHIPNLVSRLQNLPSPMRWLFGMLANTMNDHRIKKLKSYLDAPLSELIICNSATADKKVIDMFYKDGCGGEFDYRESVLKKAQTIDNFSMQTAFLDQYTYLQSILNRQDKMSMAASIESRVPFLDHRIVSFASSIPFKCKIHKRENKYVLKKVAEKYLPQEVIYRKKSGFGIPLAEWFRAKDGLGEYAHTILRNNALPEMQGILDIESLLSDHCRNINDNSEILWTALNYVTWKDQFGIS